jgi:hypothetical protein
MGAESFKLFRNETSPEQEKLKRYHEEYSFRTYLHDAGSKFAKIAGLASVLAGGSAEIAHADDYYHGSYLTAAQLNTIDTQLHRTKSAEIQLANGDALFIPTAADVHTSVDVFEPRTGKPTRVIIEYRQNHPHEADEMAELSSIEKLGNLQAIEESQQKIYSSLSGLTARGVIQSVCSEGVASDSPTMSPAETAAYYKKYSSEETLNILGRYDEAAAPLEQAREEALDVFSPTRAVKASAEETSLAIKILNSIEPKMHALTAQHQYLIGGDRKLAAEGKISLCGAEFKAINQRAWSPEVVLSEKLHDPMHQALVTKAVMSDREDAALTNALREHGDAVAIVYGAAHDFSRTVAEYNYTHPNEPIALVVVDTFVYHPTQTAAQ